MNIIFKRRSIRKYTDKKISEKDIKLMLKAGMSAPSSKNTMPWEFIVIDDKDILRKIPEFHPYSKMLLQADKAIVVCGDVEKSDIKDYWIQSCCAAVQNILLQATDLGIGSVWLALYPYEDRFKPLCELLNLPTNIVPLSIIPLGYPDEQKEPKDIYDEEKVHINSW